jgi:hypothetical protein
VSPKSRGRKPKNNSADKRSRRQQSRGPAPSEIVIESEQACDCAFCRAEDEDLDPDVLITQILELATPLV